MPMENSSRQSRTREVQNFKGPIFLPAREMDRRFGRLYPAVLTAKIPGEQIDPTDRAHRRRKKRRASGERAGCRKDASKINEALLESAGTLS